MFIVLRSYSAFYTWCSGARGVHEFRSNRAYVLIFCYCIVIVITSRTFWNSLFVEMRHDSFGMRDGQVEHWMAGVLGSASTTDATAMSG